MKGALALTLVLVALSLTAFAGSAAANPPTTPNGWEGACNMNQAWPGLRHNQHGVGVQPGGGMEHAMTVNNPNGEARHVWGHGADERRTLLSPYPRRRRATRPSGRCRSWSGSPR